MRTLCPFCKQKYDVEERFNGQGVECSKCKQKFLIEPCVECPKCRAGADADAVLCINCGYNFKTQRVTETHIEKKETLAWLAYLKHAWQMAVIIMGTCAGPFMVAQLAHERWGHKLSTFEFVVLFPICFVIICSVFYGQKQFSGKS